MAEVPSSRAAVHNRSTTRGGRMFRSPKSRFSQGGKPKQRFPRLRVTDTCIDCIRVATRSWKSWARRDARRFFLGAFAQNCVETLKAGLSVAFDQAAGG